MVSPIRRVVVTATVCVAALLAPAISCAAEPAGGDKKPKEVIIHCKYDYRKHADDPEEEILKWDGTELHHWLRGGWSIYQGYDYQATGGVIVRTLKDPYVERLTIDRTTGEYKQIVDSRHDGPYTTRHGFCRPAEEPKAMF